MSRKKTSKSRHFSRQKTHVAGMIEIITAIVTQTVVLKMDIVLTIDNCLTFNHKTTVFTL